MKKRDLCLVLGLLVLSACGDNVYTEARFLLGTRIAIRLEPVSGRSAADDADAVFRLIEDFQGLADVYRYDSQLSECNRRGRIPNAYPYEALYELAARALAIALQTGGAFDPSLLALSRLWDFSGTAAAPPDPAMIREALKRSGYRKIRVHEEYIDTSAVDGLDLGGIAKGLACDKARDALISMGYTSAILDFGGDLYLLGHKEQGEAPRPWKVGVRHPRDAGAFIRCFKLHDTAMVSSGDYARFYMHEGVRYHHILDAASGYPARSAMSVTVVGPEAMLADAYATAVFVMGVEKGLALLEALPEYDGFVVDPEGVVHYTTTLSGMLEECD